MRFCGGSCGSIEAPRPCVPAVVAGARSHPPRTAALKIACGARVLWVGLGLWVWRRGGIVVGGWVGVCLSHDFIPNSLVCGGLLCARCLVLVMWTDR